jgi:hypothetical protein
VTSFLDIAPILPTADMQGMQAHYERLGFEVHVHHGGYATAARGGAKMHFHLSEHRNAATGWGARSTSRSRTPTPSTPSGRRPG